MAWGKLWIIAYRDLGRNRRRSFFSLLAVALGLALLIVMNGLISGMLEDALQNTILLDTGHVQLRAESYQMEKLSLQWKDLIENSEELTARAQAMSQVKAAAPVLWTSSILTTQEESLGLQVYGIDTTSALYDPIRSSLVDGGFLDAEDRDGILVGQRLADDLGMGVGSKVNLAVVDADGNADEGIFEIRGLFSTGIFAYDDGTIFMPLSKAQAFTRTGGRASAVVMLLHDQDDAFDVAAAFESPGLASLDWRELNALFLETMQVGLNFYIVLYAIVILIVAVIIANTLLMAVFERIREMGILAALGMKGRQIMVMFLMEAATLGLSGIALGLVLGSVGVAYLSRVGIPIGDVGAVAEGIALGSTMTAAFNPRGMIALSVATLLVTVLASLYPAWFAARLQPAEALHAL